MTNDRLKPIKGIQIGLTKKYLFDPSVVQPYVDASAENATEAEEQANRAEQTFTNVSAFVDTSKSEITGIITQGKAEINTAVNNGRMEISDSILDATEEVKEAALDAANEAINDAAATATSIVVDYANNEIKPLLNEIASNAAESAENASESAGLAANESNSAAISATDSQHYAEDSRIWAEGSDSEVANVDGEHSSKVWSEMAKTSATSAASSADLARQYGNNKLNTTAITNCITEIPQDIKLELNNGTLTLKAGSKVYIPNGKNADGSNKFDVYTVNQDKVFSKSVSGTRGIILNTNKSLDCPNIKSCYSGETKPSATSVYWYDTVNNYVKAVTSTETPGCSLLIGIVTADDTGITSIDQVFNGLGYIGSTVFALPGVKGLIPNGRNADGSLKNIEFTVGRVITNTAPSGLNSPYPITVSADSLYPLDVYYNSRDNLIIEKRGGTIISKTDCGIATYSSGKITSFTPKLPFRAADDQEVAKLATTNNYTGENDFSAVTRFRQSVYFGRPDVDISVLPSSGNKYPTTNWFRDGEGVVMGTQDSYVTNLNTIGHRINARRTIDGVAKSANVAAEVDVNGVGVGKAPTPPMSSNGDTIATTAWCKQYIQEVSTLPANPNANVFYCVPE